MCYYGRAATHNSSDIKPKKNTKIWAWNKANTSAALKQSAEVNRERRTAVGWKCCHFICHLTVSLWTAYVWRIHPRPVHLGAIAHVHTQTHTERKPMSQPLIRSLARDDLNRPKLTKMPLLVFFCVVALLLKKNVFCKMTVVASVKVHLVRQADSLLWRSLARNFTSVQEFKLILGHDINAGFHNDRGVYAQQRPWCGQEGSLQGSGSKELPGWTPKWLYTHANTH